MMQHIVSITKQGQISIPADLRRLMDLEKTKKAFISIEKGRLIIEPAEDFLSLRGSFKTDKKVSDKKIREGFEKFLASKVK